jgi:hypothetical protein
MKQNASKFATSRRTVGAKRRQYTVQIGSATPMDRHARHPRASMHLRRVDRCRRRDDPAADADAIAGRGRSPHRQEMSLTASRTDVTRHRTTGAGSPSLHLQPLSRLPSLSPHFSPSPARWPGSGDRARGQRLFPRRIALIRMHRVVRLSDEEYASARANPTDFLNAPGHEVAAAPYGERLSSATIATELL